MKNSTLLLRSLLIVVTIAGIPHTLALYVSSTKESDIAEPQIPEIVTDEVNEGWEPYWVGKYEVSFDGIKEKAHYEIREKSDQYKCYSILLIDANGNSFEDNAIVMEDIQITDSIAKAVYQIEYEGKKLKVDSQMKMDDEGNVTLSYNYYGYEGKENWKRLEQ